MSPVIRANWLLLALATLLSLIIYLDSRQAPGDYIPISDLKSHQISRLVIKQQRITEQFQRNNGSWIELSTGAPATDPSRIAKLLHIAELPSLHRFPVADHKLEAFGLQPPRYQLQLDGLLIRFGGIDPATGLRYVQVGERIHLITDSYTHHLSPQPAP